MQASKWPARLAAAVIAACTLAATVPAMVSAASPRSSGTIECELRDRIRWADMTLTNATRREVLYSIESYENGRLVFGEDGYLAPRTTEPRSWQIAPVLNRIVITIGGEVVADRTFRPCAACPRSD